MGTGQGQSRARDSVSTGQKSMDGVSGAGQPTHPSWPEEDLEYLERCPACDASDRAVFLTGVDDKVFGIGGDGWTLFRCLDCTAAYLNPRPTEASIGRAYARYYTHAVPRYDDEQFFWNQDGFKPRLMKGYLNARYGYRFRGALPFSRIAMALRPGLRRAVDYSISHLPAPRTARSRLLDVGCGNGHFLVTARALGYETTGIEPDPTAGAVGQENGLDIRVGLLPDRTLKDRDFDHITMSHVVEHLHRPREALAQCFDLLKPGGRIWISQPNLDALGLAEFGVNWRGLEAPRHVVLFNFKSLSKLLTAIGFVQVRQLQPEEAAEFYYQQSHLMSRDVKPYDAAPPDDEMTAKAAAANLQARRDWSRSESLTVIAYRP